MSNGGEDSGGSDIVAGEQGGSVVDGREKGRSVGSSGLRSKSKSVYVIVRLYVILIVAGSCIVFFDSNSLQPIKDSYLMNTLYSHSNTYNANNVTDTLLEWVSSPLKHNNTNMNNNSSSTKEMTKKKEFTQQQQQKKAMDVSLKDGMMGGKQKKQKEIDDRPYLILHVGPPKTGTTTIQSGLLQIAQVLAEQDNYYYLGQNPHQRITIEINQNSTNSTTDGTSIHDIKMKNRDNRIRYKNYTNLNDRVSIFQVKDFIYRQPDKDFRTVIRYHLKKKQNVIISSEHYSSYFHHQNWHALYEEIFLMNHTQRQRRHNLEPFFGFNVKIIVTYRHFFQWVPSLYHQQHLNLAEPNDTIGIVDYLELYIKDLKQYVYNDDDDHNSNDGDDDDNNDNNNNDNANDNDDELSNSNLQNTSLLTYYTVGMGSRKKDTIKQQVHGSLWSYLFWSEQTFTRRNELYNRVDVYDMHQQELDTVNSTKNSKSKSSHNTNDMFTNFVCQMIPTATNTCHYLQQQQQQQQKVDGRGTTEDSHYRTSRTPNQYLTIQDRFRILQTARTMKNDMNTTTFTTPTTTTASTGTTNIINHIQQFNFTDGNRLFVKMTTRMEEWFQQHKMSSTSSSTSTNDNSSTSNNNNNNNGKNNTALLYDMNPYFLCLKATHLQQLKDISWNYLVQQILLVNRHNSVVDRRQQQQQQQHQKRKQNTTTTSFFASSLPSLFQSSTSIDNLVLSSQFNFNFNDNINDNIPNNNNNNTNKQVFLSLLHPLRIEHDALFYESVDRRLFCQINPTKVLENEDFVVSVFQNSYYNI